MAQYLMLLHGEPIDFSQFSAEAIQGLIREYKSWRERVAANGKLVGGAKLRDDGGKNMSGSNGDLRVTDGPFAEVKELIGGFFMIDAADYAEAIDISRDCPHLKYGRIELREVEPTP